MEITRRRFLVVAGQAALAAIAVGCGGSTASSPAARPTVTPAGTTPPTMAQPTAARTAISASTTPANMPAATSPAEASTAAAATRGATPSGGRVIKQAMGDTAVPASPQRVIVLEEGPLNSSLALGIKPVGAVTALEGAGFPAYLGDRTAGVPTVGTILQPNLEAVAALRPDLILSVKARHEAIYPQLSRIAPTVFTETFRGTWRDNFLKDAEALGRPDEAKQLMDNYRRRLDEFKAKMGDRLKTTTVSVVRYVPGDVYIYQKASYIGTILTDAGLSRPQSQEAEQFVLKASYEFIPQMGGEVIFVTAYGPPEKTQLAEFRNHPLWKQLDAVQKGPVYTVPDEYWMVGTGVIAADRVVDDLFAYLVEGRR